MLYEFITFIPTIAVTIAIIMTLVTYKESEA